MRVVVAAQFGDLDALDVLLRAVQGPLYRHLVFLLSSEDAADDALQEALWTISRKLSALREPRWFRAWAFRIATRIAWRQARRGRAGAMLVGLDDAGDAMAEDTSSETFDADQIAAVLEALDRVPPASQLVLRMHYEHGLTHAEIAEALGISIGTVKSRHHYGLQWLRQHVPAKDGMAPRALESRRRTASGRSPTEPRDGDGPL